MKGSTLQRDSEALLQAWAAADTEARCPMGHHEFCVKSNRGLERKRVVRSRQNRAANRKANRASTHNVGFEHPYDLKTMQAESAQIADYARKKCRNKYPKGFKK